MEFKIEDVLKRLKKRKVYISEDDLKLEIAWVIKELYNYENVKVRLEYHPSFNPNMHIDILVIIDNNKWIPIELKYKTKKCNITIDKELFILKDHKGQTDNCYKYLKDIERIETIKRQLKTSEIKFQEGYTIFISNDPSYWNNKYNPYSLIDNTIIKKQTWTEKDNSRKNKKHKSLTFDNNYSIKWELYSKIKKENETIDKKDACEFKILINKII